MSDDPSNPSLFWLPNNTVISNFIINDNGAEFPRYRVYDRPHGKLLISLDRLYVGHVQIGEDIHLCYFVDPVNPDAVHDVEGVHIVPTKKSALSCSTTARLQQKPNEEK